MNFEDYQKQGVISQLQTTEKEKYLDFHKEAYKDDLKVAKKIFTFSPRWSIVAGYYSMHDITKLYLAKHHDIKITGRGVHLAAIIALRQVISDNIVKKQVVTLLTEAQKTCEIFSSQFKEKIIPSILSKGREEREKSQYYSGNYEKLFLAKSMEFQEKIVKPYIKLIEEML